MQKLLISLFTVLLLSLPLQASILRGTSGLQSPHREINFDELSLPATTKVANQYSDYGVQFSSFLYQSPFLTDNFDGIDGDNLGNFFSLRDGRSIIRFFDIELTAPQSLMAFAFVANTPITTFSLYNDDILLETAQFATATNDKENWFTFSGLPFNRIQVDSLGTALIDNIQIPTSAISEPSQYFLLLIGLGFLFTLSRSAPKKLLQLKC